MKVDGVTEDNLADVQNYFGIMGKPNRVWMSRIEPGVKASQAVLESYLSEQTTGDSFAIEKNEADSQLASKVRSVFGSGTNEIVEQLYKRMVATKAPQEFHLNFEQSETGAHISLAEGHGNGKLKEPEEGLIPVAEAPIENPTQLDDLVKSMAPRVRLEGKPATAESILSAVNAGKWSRRVSLLIAMYQDVAPRWTYHLAAQIRKQPWLGLHYEADTVIQRARNILAQKFLQSEAEWSFWLDSDVIAPFGEPGFFYLDLGIDKNYMADKFAGAMAVERLMKAGHTIVGGVYQARKSDNMKVKSPMIIQPCLHPRHAADTALTEELRAKGPIDRVVQVGYVATGCALVHRSVYLAIMSRFPERGPKKEGQPFDFFGHDVAKSGEDIAFCGLAAEAGHQSYLDCGVWCAHLGRYAYFPNNV